MKMLLNYFICQNSISDSPDRTSALQLTRRGNDLNMDVTNRVWTPADLDFDKAVSVKPGTRVRVTDTGKCWTQTPCGTQAALVAGDAATCGAAAQFEQFEQFDAAAATAAPAAAASAGASGALEMAARPASARAQAAGAQAQATGAPAVQQVLQLQRKDFSAAAIRRMYDANVASWEDAGTITRGHQTIQTITDAGLEAFCVEYNAVLDTFGDEPAPAKATMLSRGATAPGARNAAHFERATAETMMRSDHRHRQLEARTRKGFVDRYKRELENEAKLVFMLRERVGKDALLAKIEDLEENIVDLLKMAAGASTSHKRFKVDQLDQMQSWYRTLRLSSQTSDFGAEAAFYRQLLDANKDCFWVKFGRSNPSGIDEINNSNISNYAKMFELSACH